VGDKGKRSIQYGNVGSVLRTKSGVKQDIFVSVVLCHFTKELP
jgi:hypothetical protein